MTKGRLRGPELKNDSVESLKLYRFKKLLFMYDERESLLQWINTNDMSVVDSVVVSKEDWDKSNMYWIERFYNEIQEELANMF